MKSVSPLVFASALAALLMAMAPTNVQGAQQLRQAADSVPLGFWRMYRMNSYAEGGASEKPSLLEGSPINKPAAVVDSVPGAKPSSVDDSSNADDGETK